MNAVEIEQAISELAEKPFDRQEFPFQFLEAFGNKDTTLKRLRSGVSNKSDLGGVLQTNNIHIATCTPGQTSATIAALRASPATTRGKARFILATDGDTLEAEDLTSDDPPIACAYPDFHDHFGFFLPLAGITTVKQIREAVILSAACARDDGAVFPVTAKLKGGAVGNVCKSLLKLGLIEEIPANDLNTVWRHDEERGPITLRATPLAKSTLGITEAEATTTPAEIVTASAQRRKGTKQEALIEMLRAPGGATIEEIATALEWAAHTVRGAMAGPLKKKLGLAVTSEKVEGRGRVYALK